MTLDGAKATAIGMASRFGADFAVFRMRAWPADVFLVKRVDEVPGGAEIAVVFKAGAAAQPVPVDPQGSLF
jgi:hypothetical protein